MQANINAFAPITIPNFGTGQQLGGGTATRTTSTTSGGGSKSSTLGTLGTIAGVIGTALPLLSKLGVFGEGDISGALSNLFGLGRTGAGVGASAIQPTIATPLEDILGLGSVGATGLTNLTTIPDFGDLTAAEAALGSEGASSSLSDTLSNLLGNSGPLGPISIGLGAANFFGNLGQKGVRSEFLGPFGFSTGGQTIQDYKAEMAGGRQITNQVFSQLQAGQAIAPGDMRGGFFSPVFGPSARGFNRQALTPEMIQADPSLWPGADREDMSSEGFVVDSPAIGLRIAQEILTGKRRRGEGMVNGTYITQNTGPYAPAGQFELVNPPKPDGSPTGTGKFITVPAFAVKADDVDVWLKDHPQPYTVGGLQQTVDAASNRDRQRELRDYRRGGGSPRD